VWISWAGFAVVWGVHEKVAACSETVKGRGHLENVDVDVRLMVICMRVLKAEGVGVVWVRIGFSGDLG
jgi:hypothetical protein